MKKNESTLRSDLLRACWQLDKSGLNQGTSGNASLRLPDGFLVTPSGMPVRQLTPDSMVKMYMDGSVAYGDAAGLKPSSEWRFHLDIYSNRDDANAIVHTHSSFATALSTLRSGVPAFHYMVAVAGGDNIRCAPYALFGSQELSNNVIVALQNRKACLMANHGMIAIGGDYEKTLYIAQEVELLCKQYVHALQIGKPILLTEEEMAAVQRQFKGYGASGQSS